MAPRLAGMPAWPDPTRNRSGSSAARSGRNTLASSTQAVPAFVAAAMADNAAASAARPQNCSRRMRQHVTGLPAQASASRAGHLLLALRP